MSNANAVQSGDLLQGQHLTVINEDCRTALARLPDASVNCCVTSPPYWGLRNYGHKDQIGQEKTPAEYVSAMVSVFVEIWRVLRDDGTVWLNLGDSYAAGGKGGGGSYMKDHRAWQDRKNLKGWRAAPPGLKAKDLVGIPWRVAFALQEAGWYLRSDIIWAKPNCMPESVIDRPARSHEYIFLLSKSRKYYYDNEAIKEPCSESYAKDPRWVTGPKDGNTKNGYEESGAQNPKRVHAVFKNAAAYNGKNQTKQSGHGRRHAGFNQRWDESETNGHAPLMRNKRDVWTVSPAIYLQAHFATFSPALIQPCILAGCPVGGVVLDPFAGSGTTGQVAIELGRRAVLVELNPEYVKLINQRCAVTPGLPLSL